MSKKERNITFTEDIAKQVAEEFGLTYEEAMAVWENEVRYLRKMMAEDDSYAITIPHFGTMYLSQKKLQSSKRAQERSKRNGKNIDEEKHQQTEKRIQEIEDFAQARRDSKAKGRIMHVKKPILWILQKKSGKTLDQMEEVQYNVNKDDN